MPVKLLSTVLFVTLSASSWSATFVVNNTADEADGETATDVTLREAVIAANANPGADVVQLAASTTYFLGLGAADSGVDENLEAQGDLDVLDTLTIEGNGSTIDANDLDRIFHVDSGATLTVRDLTITDGRTNVSSGLGGGVLVDLNSTGVFEDCSVTNCEAAGLVSVGGGVNVRAGTLTMTRCILSGNTTLQSQGGGIGMSSLIAEMLPSVTLTDCTFSGNTASTNAGGLAINGNAAVTNCTFFNNQANGTGSVNGGGAVSISNNSTSATLTSCTLSGNRANGNGGAVALVAGTGTLNLNHVTITNNTANLDDTGGGNGGGVWNNAGTINYKNSILSGNTVNAGGGGTGTDVSGTLTDGGSNIVGGSPLLGVLADNGGFTETHALMMGSPAIDAGDAGGSPALDQRGLGRNGDPDMGSYEFNGLSPATPTPTVTETATVTPTGTSTSTATQTPTQTFTNTITETPTETPTETITETPTETVTETATPTVTETPTSTVTETFTPTVTETFTPTVTETFTPTVTETFTPTITETFTPTVTETFTPTSTATFTTTFTPTPTGLPDTMGMLFDLLGVDVDMDGTPEPGDTLTYVFTIANKGIGPATGVIGSVTLDLNTMFVPGSVSTTPIAIDDNYQAAENASLIVSASGVLANDFDLDMDPLIVSSASATSVLGATVSANTDGSFTYNPTALGLGLATGQVVGDSFDYEIEDASGNHDAGRVYIEVEGP